MGYEKSLPNKFDLIGNAVVTPDFVRTSQEKRSFFVTTGSRTVTLTSESPFFLVRNPSSNTRVLMVMHYKLMLDSTSGRSLVRFYKNPTITSNGTTLTPSNNYIENPQTNSLMGLYYDPTISSNGTIIDMAVVATDTQGSPIGRVVFVHPGNDLLMTVTNSLTAIPTVANCLFCEVDL